MEQTNFDTNKIIRILHSLGYMKNSLNINTPISRSCSLVTPFAGGGVLFIFMKEIKLSKGRWHPSANSDRYVALVDNEDYEYLNQFNWHVVFRKDCKVPSEIQGYVLGEYIKMHRLVMKVSDSKVCIDHADGNPLNNQKYNLRACTHTQNMANRKVPANNKSGYKGVSWHKQHGKWYASISANRKLIFLGLFADLIEAAKAYDAKAKEIHGEFANLNFKA